jgi:N-methylhydantoinase A
MTAKGGLRLGVDVGGTFTDFSLSDTASGEVHHFKRPSTPSEPSDALIKGIAELTARHGLDPERIEYFAHGTTLALNTVIQRRGARSALVVTRGHRSVLDIARLRVPEQFNFAPTVPPPLIPGGMVFEVDGRMRASGQELVPLSQNDIEGVCTWLREAQVEACAIALLNSYANPEHERALAEAIGRECPGVAVCASSALWPQFREYERAIVAVLNAYVSRVMDDYLVRLGDEAAGAGLGARIYITKSNGGVMSADSARHAPVETLLSGPASGVVGAAFTAATAETPNCVTFDMGGTSADVSLIVGGQPVHSTEAVVGEYPMVMPSVDVSAIGAGGGSIAWIDPYGLLKVGPDSAGAAPGPACYGAGGTAATVTDAYVVCGFLDPDNFLGGEMRLDRELARAALARLAEPLGVTVERVAEDVLRVATANMATQFLPLMAQRGIDPRDYALLPYGGAGPTHACLLAEEVGIRRVVVPASPGTLCATGALINDVVRDYVRAVRAPLEALRLDDVRLQFSEIQAEAQAWLDSEPIDVLERRVLTSGDMRYRGQAYDVEVPLDLGAVDSIDDIGRAFHARHAAIYQHSDPTARVEMLSIRVRIVGVTPTIGLPVLATSHAGSAAPSPNGRREMLVRGQAHDAAVHSRAELQEGAVISGPAIVEQPDTTVPVPPGWVLRVQAHGVLVIDAIEGESG